MSISNMTRRAALASFAAALSLAPVQALARARRVAGGGVRVDVTPLLENSGNPTAAWVARLLPQAMAEAIAGRGGAGAPVTVRVDYVMLGPSQGGAGPAGSAPDQMIGAVIVGGVSRPLRATSYYYPSAVDQAMLEQSNYYRVEQLVQTFAYWAAQEV